MRDQLIRSTVAVPVAVLLPFGVDALRARQVRAVVVGGLVMAALTPLLDRWEAWLTIVVAAAAAAIPREFDVSRPWWPVALAVLATAAGAALAGAEQTGEALVSVGESRDLVVVTAGAVATIFIGGAVIARILHPFAERVDSTDTVMGMENAGRYIGWLERALLYALVLAGAADAAALVLAGKSIARFPSFSQERFAEYYLIGTLLSLLVAAGAAVGVRAAIGLDPLPK